MTMFDEWCKSGDGFLLVFDLTNKESFNNIRYKYYRILKNKGGCEVPIVLVGFIEDLNLERKVSFSEAAELAYSLKIEYLEIYNNFSNSNSAFKIITKEILLFKEGKKIFKEYKKRLKRLKIYYKKIMILLIIITVFLFHY